MTLFDEKKKKPGFYLGFITNQKACVIFLQSIPLSTTFLLTIWGFGQYLLLYLSSKSNIASPCAMLSQGRSTENVARIEHGAPCY